uniref:Obscurin, cytoskeletal calmodulin and titin-interacting RhoGEF n=1 Tax=Taeniopygia guttata TaxID=59729 RepID=A0A674GZZ3_TAEGU
MDYSSLSGVPRFLTRPKAFMVSVGKDATLSCQIVGNPIPVVSWEKDKLPVQSGGRFKTTEDGDLYRLTIYDLSLEDSGQYICRAKNTIGEAFAAVSIKVGEETTVTESAPYFIQKPSNIKVTLGEDAMFKCKVQGSPPLSVNWEKDGRYLRNKADAGRFQIESSGESNALTIQCAQLGDSGTYTCRAENLIGSASASAALVVETHGSSNPGNWDSSCGKTASLLSHLQKRREEIRKMDISHGTLDAASAQSYSAVEGLSGIGYSLSRDYERAAGLTKGARNATFGALTRTCSVTEGKHAKLSCYVTGEPKPVIVWKKDNEVILEGRRHVIYEDDQENFVLKILFCKQTDNGLYTCTASNLAGQTYSSVLVTVKGNIIKKLPRKTAVFINDTATFCVELDNDCQNIRWLKNREEVKPSDRISITRSGKQHTMTIRECKMEDAGEIAFLADESRTSTQFTYVRCVIVSPTSPTLFKLETSVTLAWSPPRMERPIPVDGYIVERKKLTGFTWVRCHESHVPSPELTVSNLAEEADYQFRVSAVNAYGQSPYLEFPGSLHLGEHETGSQWGAEVAPGGDALFTVDLTKTCSGTWYLNGKALQESETYIINRTQTTHSLVIKNVTRKDDGAEVKFVANDVETILCPHLIAFKDRQSLIFTFAALSENATLSCEVAQEKTEVKWYKDGKLITSSKKFKVESEGKSRRLVVGQVEKKDAGEYTCEAAGQKLTFRIVDKVKKEVKAALSENATLSCEVAQEKTEVKWYKDGKLISSSKKFKVESEGKSRRLVVGQVEKKDAGEYTCEAADAFVHKEKVQKEVKAALSENATLSCEVAQEKTEVKWYKDGKLISSSKKFKVESEGKSRRLVVGQKKDAGEYTCEAAESLDFSLFPEPEVVFTNKEKVQKEVKAALSENATLSCEVAQEKTEVKWYKDGKLISSSKKFKVESEGKSRRLVVGQVEKKDAGEYTCEAAGSYFPNFQVATPPHRRIGTAQWWQLVLAKPLIVQEHESITLTTSVTPETAAVRWFKDGTEIKASKKCVIKSEGASRTLTVNAAESTDSALYTCQTKDDKQEFRVQVKEIPVKFAKKLEAVKAEIGGSVSLSCELSHAKGKVTWSRNGVEVKPSKRFQIREEGTKRTLTITGIRAEDEGEYSCDDSVEGSLGFVLSLVKFVTSLNSVVSEEGKEAVFKCTVSPSDAVVTWLRNGAKIEASKKYVISQKDTNHSLTITDLTLEDAAEITASAEGVESTANLRVREASISFTKKLEPKTVEERETVTLEVELNKPAEVKWMRNSIVLKPSDKIEIKAEGTKHTLVVRDISFADRGFYCCESPDDKTQAKINVESEFSNLWFHKYPRQGLEPLEVAEKGTVTFEVEVSHEDVEGTWQKDGVRLKPAPNISFGVLGKKHSLTLSSVALEDAGLISFKAEGINSSGKLTVTELPVKIVKPLRDKIALWKHRGVLECQVSRANAKVRWFKKDVEIHPSQKYEIVSEGVYRKLVINDADYEDEDTYTCDAFDDKTSANFFVEGRKPLFSPLECTGRRMEANFECETSIPSVKPAKWFLKGAALQAGRNIIMQQEGTIHRLTIIKTSVDMTGTIQFSIGKSKSTANLLVRAWLERKLEDKTVLERHSVILSCDFRPSPKHVKWFKGQVLIEPSEKYKIKRDQYSAELKIMKVKPEDAGVYKCRAGIAETEATLSVEGTRGLQQQGWPGAGLYDSLFYSRFFLLRRGRFPRVIF